MKFVNHLQKYNLVSKNMSEIADNGRHIGEKQFKLCGVQFDSQWTHYNDVIMFTQPFIRSRIKENFKAPSHWPLSGEFTGHRWIPRTNGQWRGKCLHLMTSSWRQLSGRKSWDRILTKFVSCVYIYGSHVVSIIYITLQNKNILPHGKLVHYIFMLPPLT